jgi:hypothetical protein
MEMMSLKHPKTLFGRTLYRVVLLCAVALAPVLLLVFVLFDYLVDEYVSDLKEIFSSFPEAFRQGHAL